MNPTTKAAVIEALEEVKQLLALGFNVEMQIADALKLLRSEPEPTPEPGERERFEAWCEAHLMPAESDWFRREPDEPDEYRHPMIDMAWAAWQARASLPPAPEPVAGWQWVPVAERLPKPFEEVLIYPRPTDYCCEGQVDCKGQWTYSEYERDGVVTYKIQPTHWAALPPAPTKGTE